MYRMIDYGSRKNTTQHRYSETFPSTPSTLREAFRITAPSKSYDHCYPSTTQVEKQLTPLKSFKQVEMTSNPNFEIWSGRSFLTAAIAFIASAICLRRICWCFCRMVTGGSAPTRVLTEKSQLRPLTSQHKHLPPLSVFDNTTRKTRTHPETTIPILTSSSSSPKGVTSSTRTIHGKQSPSPTPL
jgi:hypothetical protein